MLTISVKDIALIQHRLNKFRHEGLKNSIVRCDQQMADNSAAEVELYLNQLHMIYARLTNQAYKTERTFDPLYFFTCGAPEVTLVIPVKNEFYSTYRCLSSLLLASNNVKFNVIVADDASSDQTSVIQTFVHNVQYVRVHQGVGYSQICNLAVKQVTTKYLVIIDNHFEFASGWLDETLNIASGSVNVGMVGIKCINTDGTIYSAGDAVVRHGELSTCVVGDDADDPRYCYVKESAFVARTCLVIPTAVWRENGGLSELSFSPEMAVADFSFRLKEQGYRTVYTPFSQTIRHPALDLKTPDSTESTIVGTVISAKFKARWGQVLKRITPSERPNTIKKNVSPARRVLFIDAETPKPDQDAGGYAAVQEMTLLQSLGYRCTFAALDMKWQPDYTEALQRKGIECVYMPFESSLIGLIHRRGSEFELIYVTRYYVAKQTIDAIRQFASQSKVVLMNADLHFLRELRAGLHNGDAATLLRASQTRDDELNIMKQVDLVLSYTDIERTVIQSHNFAQTKVAKCPWVCEVATEVKPFGKRSGLAFLGGFQHPPNEEAVRWFVTQVLPVLLKDYPQIIFHIYGSSISAELIAEFSQYPNVIVEGWVANTASIFDRCRVFVAPLQSGAGIKGKVVSALAAGVPTIMSAIAAEGISVVDGEYASIASTVDEWVERIVKIYHDEELWASMSQAALKFASVNYSLQNGRAAIANALAQL
jgi:GT2 family glycosyltransferase